MALWKAFHFGTLATMSLAAVVASQAQNPCDGPDRRALIFSGGGIKGAFEAGAAYHLIVHRACDFHDFAGISVGAIDGTILAQAPRSDDWEESHAALASQAESLVTLWESLKSSRDIVRPRKFAGLRFAMFGAENLNDFTPLRRLLQSIVSIDKIGAGRPLRIGVTSFRTGEYEEIVANQGEFNIAKSRFLDYLYASAVVPVIGRMPHIAPRDQEPENRKFVQFADGSLRHVTPVASYFGACASASGSNSTRPAHQPLQQLFVIATSPYNRGSYLLPPAHANYERTGTKLITDGRKVMRRAIAVIADTPFRSDLDFMLLANELLQWRMNLDLEFSETAEKDEATESGFQTGAGFPIESYNREGLGFEAHSRPYLIVLVKPKEETADLADLLSFSPQTIRSQLLSGCLAADETMQSEFGLVSIADQCAQRFGSQRAAAVRSAK